MQEGHCHQALQTLTCCSPWLLSAATCSCWQQGSRQLPGVVPSPCPSLPAVRALWPVPAAQPLLCCTAAFAFENLPAGESQAWSEAEEEQQVRGRALLPAAGPRGAGSSQRGPPLGSEPRRTRTRPRPARGRGAAAGGGRRGGQGRGKREQGVPRGSGPRSASSFPARGRRRWTATGPRCRCWSC